MLDAAIAPITFRCRLDFTARDDDRISLAKAGDSVATIDADPALVEAVGRALCATGYAALRDVQVESRRGIVVLSGHVASYHQKQLAQATAQQLAGVCEVRNSIEVINCR